MNKGMALIVSGPSGSGKDTILDAVFAKVPDIKFSISCTTREKRPEDFKKNKYSFVSKDTFLDMIKNDELLEYNLYVNNYYGTPRKLIDEAVSAGEDIIIEVDVNGAANIRSKLPQAVSIFIMPPSFEILKARLSKRGDVAPELVEKRLREALSEITRACEYDYIVVNDKLDDAVNDFLSIINAERQKAYKKTDLVNEVLSKC